MHSKYLILLLIICSIIPPLDGQDRRIYSLSSDDPDFGPPNYEISNSTETMIPFITTTTEAIMTTMSNGDLIENTDSKPLSMDVESNPGITIVPDMLNDWVQEKLDTFYDRKIVENEKKFIQMIENWQTLVQNQINETLSEQNEFQHDYNQTILKIEEKFNQLFDEWLISINEKIDDRFKNLVSSMNTTTTTTEPIATTLMTDVGDDNETMHSNITDTKNNSFKTFFPEISIETLFLFLIQIEIIIIISIVMCFYPFKKQNLADENVNGIGTDSPVKMIRRRNFEFDNEGFISNNDQFEQPEQFQEVAIAVNPRQQQRNESTKFELIEFKNLQSFQQPAASSSSSTMPAGNNPPTIKFINIDGNYHV